MSTLADFRTAVSALVGLSGEVGGNEESYVDRWVNQGIVDFLLQTQCHVNCATLSFSSGVSNYNLPTAALAIQDVTYQSAAASTTSRLQRVSPQEILRLREQSSNSSSVVSYYALNGNDLLMIYPTPSASDTLSIYYVPRPTALSVSSHDPSNESYGGIPSEYHEAIEYYAAWKAADFDDSVSTQKGLMYQQQYLARLRQYRKAILRRGGRHLGRVIIGRSALRASNRSQDQGAW